MGRSRIEIRELRFCVNSRISVGSVSQYETQIKKVSISERVTCPILGTGYRSQSRIDTRRFLVCELAWPFENARTIPIRDCHERWQFETKIRDLGPALAICHALWRNSTSLNLGRALAIGNLWIQLFAF